MHNVVDGLLAMLEVLGSAFLTKSTMTKALLLSLGENKNGAASRACLSAAFPFAVPRVLRG